MTIYDDFRLYLERRRSVMVTRNSFAGDGHGNGDRGRPFDSNWRRCTCDDNYYSCCIVCVYDEWLRVVRLEDSYYNSGHVPCIRARWTTDSYCATRDCRIYGRARVFFVLQPRGGSSSRRCTRARLTLVQVFLFFNFLRRNFARRRRRVFLTRVTRTRRSQRPAWTSDGWCSGGVLRRSRRTRSWPLLL